MKTKIVYLTTVEIQHLEVLLKNDWRKNGTDNYAIINKLRNAQ